MTVIIDLGIIAYINNILIDSQTQLSSIEEISDINERQ
jgi:hypothetical protein